MIVLNASDLIWLNLVAISGIFIIYLPITLLVYRCDKSKRNSKWPARCRSFKGKLDGFFFFNGLIRIFMESFLDLTLSAVLNLMMADWETEYFWEHFSNMCSLAWMAFAGVIMICLAFVSMCSISQFEDQMIKGRIGAIYDGLELRD